AKEALKLLRRQGLEFKLGAKVTGVELLEGATAGSKRDKGARGEPRSKSARVDIEGHEPLEADKVLVCVGRRPATSGLGLEEAGVELDERGRIKVDDGFATSAPGVYAIGDLIHGPMLAHKAEEDGVALVELLAGHAAGV